MATPLPTTEFTLMTREEVTREFPANTAYAARCTGFKLKQLDFPKLLFIKDPVDAHEPGLLVRLGAIPDGLSITVLYTPAQIARGDYEKAVRDIFGLNVGRLPRLDNGGKPKQKEPVL